MFIICIIGEPIKDVEQLRTIRALLSQPAQLAFTMAIYTSIELEDAVGLTVKDVEGKYLQLKKVRGPGRQPVLINGQLRDAINEYVDGRSADRLLLLDKDMRGPVNAQAIYDEIESAAMKVGFTAFGSATLSRTNMYHLYQVSGNITIVQDMRCFKYEDDAWEYIDESPPESEPTHRDIDLKIFL